MSICRKDSIISDETENCYIYHVSIEITFLRILLWIYLCSIRYKLDNKIKFTFLVAVYLLKYLQLIHWDHLSEGRCRKDVFVTKKWKLFKQVDYILDTFKTIQHTVEKQKELIFTSYSRSNVNSLETSFRQNILIFFCWVS